MFGVFVPHLTRFSLSDVMGVWVESNDSEYVWKLGGVPGKLLHTMWPWYEGMGTTYGEDVHLLLSSGLHPRAAAQYHCSLGPLQTY